MRKSSQEKVGISPDTERALRADTEMKYPKTQDITRKNEGRADAFAFYYLVFCKGSQNHIRDKYGFS